MPHVPPSGAADDPTDALRRSEQRYRALVEACSGTVWSWSPAGGPVSFQHVERWWEGLTGQSPADQTRTPTAWADVVHPDDRAATLAAWGHAISSGTPYDATYRVRARGGGESHVHTRAVPIRDPDGGVVEWVGMHTDVTDSRRAAADRERLLREVDAERRRLADVFHHAPAFMCVLRGPDHVYERANERYLELMGRAAGDLVGRPVREAVPEMEGQGFLELLDRVYATGEPFVGTGVPVTLRRGGVLGGRLLDFVYQPLRDPDGVVTGILVQGIDRTEGKAAEEAVRVSEERFRLAVEATEDAIWDLDVAAGAVHWSERYAVTFGRPPGSGGSWQWWIDRIHPDDRGRVSAGLRAAVDGADAQWAAAYRFLRADGAWADIEDRALIARDASGAACRVVGAMRDVTARKRAEAELFASRETLRAVLDGIPQRVFWKAPDLTYLGCNRPFARDMGFGSPEDVIGRDDFQGAWAEVAEAFRADDRRVIESGAAKLDYEEVLAGADGGRQWVRTSKQPLRGPDGRVVGVLGTYEDVTDRRRAEEELRMRDRALGAATQGLVITDPTRPDHPLVYVSPGFERLTGYPAAEAVGRNCRFLQGPGTDSAAVELLRDAVRDGRAVTVELLNYRRDGTPFWNEVSVSPVAEADGRVTHFVGVQTDVTERHALEQQFRQSQKMEAFGQLAGGVAHDFNNLLTVINGYTDLLLDRLPAADPARRLLGEVRKAGERSAALTRQLLAFSRKQVVAPRVLDPNAVVGDLASLLRKLIGEDVRLETAFDPRVCPVLADPGQVEQVLMNLCVNARDAMPTGGTLRVETRNADVPPAETASHPGARPGPHAVLGVSDTGTGMPPEVLARVFEPFFTTKGVGRGTGLGLATVHGIVTQAGGHVRVTSRVGVGTTFAVYLPRAGAAAVAEDAEVKSGIRKPAKGGETVLVVEDEDGVRAFVRAVLEGCGYRVLEAADGEQAIGVAEAHPGRLHLLMTDVVMPGIGGRAAAERVAARHPEAKVLFVSGYTDDAVVRHGVSADAVHFLQKPFSPGTLAAKVREVLGG